MGDPATSDQRHGRGWSTIADQQKGDPLKSIAVARLVRFGISGACATIAYFVISNALHYGLYLSASTASLLSYMISVVLSYLLQSRFTFQMKRDSSRQIGRFVAATLVGLAVSWGLVRLLTDIFSQPAWAAIIAVCIAIPALNYALFHLWVFVEADPSADPR